LVTSLRNFVLITAAAFTLGCVTGAQESVQTKPGETEALSRPPGSIAYIGRDGGIWTHSPERGSSRRITEAGAGGFAHPTWGPDGQSLAFVDGSGQLYVAKGRRVRSFDSQGNPFYLYWNPEGNRISYLGPGPSGRGLDLQVADLATGAVQLIGTGQPYYWVWSPSGDSMLTHTGGASLSNPEFAQMRLLTGEGLRGGPLPLSPGFFQSPAVSPTGTEFVVVAQEPGDSTLIARAVGYRVAQQPPAEKLLLLSDRGAVKKELARVEGIASFDWAPTGHWIAFVDGISTPFGGIVGPLVLIDPQDGRIWNAQTGPVLAYFWAPDGESLVAFRPRMSSEGQPGLEFEILLVDAARERMESIGSFLPTEHFLRTIVPFYDQYQRSATIWAPDSSAIVVNSRTREGPSVLMIDIKGDGAPTVIDQGFHPVWSP
jgi:hypothetical protein